MQYLWIGCLESDEEFKKKAKKGYDLASAQVSQKNLIEGLESVGNFSFDSVNGSVLPPYPVYEDKNVDEVVWSHKANSFDISVGYKNIKYLNRLYCKKSMIKAADLWVKNRYSGNGLTVFVYSMRSAPMATACYIKRKIPEAKLILIITDLPQFMDLGENRIKKTLKKIDWITIKQMQRDFDGFVLYAAKMAEYLNIPSDKWILMEGSYDISEQIMSVKEKKKAIMYSGKLDEQYGIKMLVDAFMSVQDSDIELWITGGGNTEGYIRECVKKDSRIKFYGFLPSRNDVLKLQQQASLLVNMRLPSEPASAYCFPSKLFEYMATGTPVLSFKLEGIPSEYLDKLILIENETVSAVKSAIINGLNMSSEERTIIGHKAQKYIIEEKSKNKQCERIMSFI